MKGMLATAAAQKPQPATEPEQEAKLKMGEEAEDEGSGDAAYDKAIGIVREALYGKEAARDVAKAMQSANDPAEGLATTAYEMVAVADEATEGMVPDEMLVPLASEVLGEVADIAIAAGIEVRGATIAKAMQSMILRYVTEQGMDPTQLREAMAQVDQEQLGATLDAEMAKEA
jgi:hypothetical protein